MASMTRKHISYSNSKTGTLVVQGQGRAKGKEPRKVPPEISIHGDMRLSDL